MPNSRSSNRLEQAAKDYPALYPFGTNLERFLDAEEEEEASFEERLRSSWRYLVGRINRFAATLKPREAAILDVEDCVNSVVERLIENDHLWDPSRGRYSTFVEAVMTSVLATCHEKAKTVNGPSNSFARMKAYHDREAKGTLTPAMRETMVRIEKAMGDYEDLDGRSFETNGHDEDDMILLRRAIRTFEDPIQVWVLVRKLGLFGMERMTFVEIAKELGVSESTVRRTNRIARRKIRIYLIEHRRNYDGEALYDSH